MASTAMNRDVLSFDMGLAYEIALKYETGKVISNGRVMFSTTDNEVFFLAQDDADKIYELELRPQEKFRVIKTRSGLQVERIPHIQGRREMEAPAALGTAIVEQPQPQNNSLSGIMASSYIAAIDALVIAEQYAQKKGVTFKITTGEIRSSAHCCFIAMTRNMNGVTR